MYKEVIQMLHVLDEKVIRSAENIENEYRDCKYVLTNYTNLENPEGYLYCVSTSDDSFDEICRIANQFSKDNVPSILMGSYNNGGGLGVQYEIKR